MPSVDFHEGTLRLRGFSRDELASFSRIPLRFDPRDHCHRCDAMWTGPLRSLLAPSIDWNVDDFNQDVGDVPIPDRRIIRLRGDQLAAIDDFEAGGRRGILVLPTGTGKTVIAIELMIRHAASVLVVVPVRDLMYQWHDRIGQATGIDAGLIGDGVHRVSPISVTTYDSAAIHMPRIGNRFSMIVLDEIHHLAGPWRSDAARMSAATVRLGLTATPPGDGQRLAVLKECVGPILHQQTIAAAAGETLADYTIRRIAVRMSDGEARRYRELGKRLSEFVFEQRELDPSFRWEDVHALTAAAREDPARAAAATSAVSAFRAKRKIEEHAEAKFRTLEDLFRLHAGEPVIVFTGSNVMARQIATRFMVPCLLSHCAKRERREYLEGFAAGRYPVLVANRVLDEGVDLPEVKTAVVLGGMSSGRQAIQRLGRVLRKGDGGRATLYEVVTDKTSEVKRSRDRRRNEAYRKLK